MSDAIKLLRALPAKAALDRLVADLRPLSPESRGNRRLDAVVVRRVLNALGPLLDVAEAATEYQAANEWAEESVWEHDEGSRLSDDELRAYRDTIDRSRRRANNARRELFDAIEKLEDVK